MTKRVAPTNRLLAALSDQSRQQFQASCDNVQLTFAEVLCESGKQIQHVYFPIDSFVSLVTALDDRAQLEVGLVGSEGMLGASLVLGVNVSPQHAVVQGPGTALRMSAAVFLNYYKKSVTLRKELTRYIYVLLIQLAQSAACSHYHLVEARLARWLLMTRDRADSNQFHITHEFLAYMLGVRRVGITEAASALHARGLIEYSRGEVAILDSAGLEKAACGCYRQSAQMYEQTMGSPRAVTRRRCAVRAK